MFLPPSVPALWLWWGTVDPEIQVPSAMNPDLLKVRVGQNIALCASLTVRNFLFFISGFQFIQVSFFLNSLPAL